MLVLSRKVNEKILIGKNVEVTVVRIDGGRVRLAIEAPTNVIIMRSEISKRIPKEIEGSHEVFSFQSPTEGNRAVLP